MSTVRAVPAAGEMPRLRSLVRVVQTDAHEGPTYVPDEDALYFTSLPRPRVDVKRLQLHGDDLERETRDVTVVRADASGANGMAAGPDGRLVVCEQGSLERPARIALVDRATGAAETLVEEWGGRPLNSPNDVAVKGDGTIWFTDPAYGFLQGFRPEPQLGDFVYRHDPRTGRTSVVTDGFDKPTAWPSRRTSASSTSATRAPTRRPGPFTPRGPIAWRPSTSSAGAASPGAACWPSSHPAAPTASRSTAPVVCTSRP